MYKSIKHIHLLDDSMQDAGMKEVWNFEYGVCAIGGDPMSQANDSV
jgi:hypothetical protein